MSWSYDNTDFDTTTSSGRLNAVRLLVGDTDTNDQQVQDEEITFALAQNGDAIYWAAAWVARAIASKYARLVDIDLDGQLAESYSQLQKHYKAKSDSLEIEARTTGGGLGVVAGGIKVSEMDVARKLEDRFKPRIRRDQFRYSDEILDDYSNNNS